MHRLNVFAGAPGAPSAVEWFVLVVGALLVVRYAWLMDDAFVYFRYVDNLVLLRVGLVYNAGEYVAGYSSVLWCAVLVVLRALGADYWTVVRLLGLGCWCAFWGLAVAVNRRLSSPGVRIVNAPLLFLAGNYGVLCYFTSGLETPLVQVLAMLFAYAHLRAGRIPTAAIVCVAAAPLVRYELVLPLVLLTLHDWKVAHRFPVFLAGWSLMFVGAMCAFNVYYYADLLPNTFYLKDNVDVEQGLYYLDDTIGPYGGYFIVPLCAIAYGFLVRRGCSHQALRSPARILMILSGGAVCAYVVRIGGDPRHFRYLAYPFCISVVAAGGIAERVVSILVPHLSKRMVGLLSLLVLAGSVALVPRQLSGHPLLGNEAASFVLRIGDAAHHRRHPSLAFLDPWGAPMDDTLRMRIAYGTTMASGGLHYRAVDVGNWCFDNYRRFDVRIVHDLGLTDPILAHTEMPFDRPAHKHGLQPMAVSLAALYSRVSEGEPRTPGLLERANAHGERVGWIVANAGAIRRIEERAYNGHRFGENVRLAVTPIPQIQPWARPTEVDDLGDPWKAVSPLPGR